MEKDINNLLERLAAGLEDSNLRGAEGIIEAISRLQQDVRSSKTDKD